MNFDRTVNYTGYSLNTVGQLDQSPNILISIKVKSKYLTRSVAKDIQYAAEDNLILPTPSEYSRAIIGISSVQQTTGKRKTVIQVAESR